MTSLMLVDAAGLYFRAFYAVPDSITTPDGRPINAVRGFLDMAASLIDKRRPTRWVACLDLDWRPAFRVELIPTYKAHRVAKDGGEEVPDTLSPQVPILLEVLTAFGLACAGAEGFEADDVIAALAQREADNGGDPVEVVTGDRDLIALATERTTVLYTGRGLAKMETLDPAAVLAKYGVPAEHYADFAILRGDSSDGLPGVAGVGEKTAAVLVSRFGAIEDIVAAAKTGDDGFPAGAAAKIRKSLDYLAVAPAAVRGRTDAPVDDVADELPAQPRNADRLAALTAELGLENSVARMQKAIAAALS